MCMHSVLLGGEEQRLLLEKAEEMDMTEGSYVFIPYDALTYSMPYQKEAYSVLDDSINLRRAYDAVLTVTIDSPERSFREAFGEAQEKRELPAHLSADKAHPLFGTIFNSVYFLAKAVENARRAGTRVAGSSVADHAKDFKLEGFSQTVSAGENGEVGLSYIILDTDDKSSQLWPTYKVDVATGVLRYVGHAVHWPYNTRPSSDSGCWFDPATICTGGVEIGSVFLFFLMVIGLFLGGSALAYYLRLRFLHGQLMKGPNKIILTLDDLTFIHAQNSRKKLDGSRSSLAGKGSLDMKSSNDVAADVENSSLAVVEGDWVWLKKIPASKNTEIKPATQRVFCKLRDLRHENVNLYLGFFHDCGVSAIVSEHCARGSLQDLLHNEDMKLDWMFKSSLLLDLIKGMKFLHHQEVAHGRLKSRNCVVDGRFVLKVTDHGYNELLEAQKITREPLKPEG